MDNRKISGFTLIELLVVIAVIGVLAGLVLISVNPALQLQRARDAGRKAALVQIAHGINDFYAVHGYYPISTVIEGLVSDSAGGRGWEADCWVGVSGDWIFDGNHDYASVATEIHPEPHDPNDPCIWPYGNDGSSTGPATYAYESDGTKFALVTRLENHTDKDTAQNRTAAGRPYLSPWTGTDLSTVSLPGQPYTYWITSGN